MHKVLDFLLKPFGQNLPIFLALWFLASSATVYYWSIHGNPLYGIYMGGHGFIQVYFIVLVLGLLRGKFHSIVQWTLLILGIINLIADTCVQRIMYYGFTGDMVAIILGSNLSEASEFLPMYFTSQAVIFIVIILAIVSAILLFRNTISKWAKRWMQWGLFAALLASILVVTARHSKNWEGVFLNKIGLFLAYDAPVELTEYRTNPDLFFTGEQPQNIVLIIGESLSKRHCSLYGYPLKTTPLLDGMAADSSLIVYNHITSAYTNTIGAFERIMTTYDNQEPADSAWYKYTFLEDVMSMAGYETTWISNQSSSGIYDNIVAKFAALSDTVEWVGPKGLGIGKTNKDEEVFPYVESYASQTKDGNNFLILHLMGSHEGFSTRYPASYARFHQEDYLSKPEEQRATLAAYDNSVLYSDYVVSTVMHYFDNQEALVFFFPDHSLDIYDSDPTYAGHARTGDKVSLQAGEDIPFVVYPTRQFQDRFPEKTKKLREAQDHVFNTEDMIYTIMDICNVRFESDSTTVARSLLQNE